MERNWKNNVKNTFENRKIIPTKEIWNELETQLDKQHTKYRRKRQLYYAAASIIMLFLGIGMFCSQDFFRRKRASEEFSVVISNSEYKKYIPAENIQLQNIQKRSSGKDTANLLIIKKDYVNPNTIFVNKKEASVENILKEEVKKETSFEVENYIENILEDLSSDNIVMTLQEELLFEQRVDSIFQAMYFTNINPNELLLVASTEAMLDNYIEKSLDSENMLSDDERSDFKQRARIFFEKINDEYDKLKIAFHQIKKNH